MKNYLIIGASGKVGSEVLKLLQTHSDAKIRVTTSKAGSNKSRA